MLPVLGRLITGHAYVLSGQRFPCKLMLGDCSGSQDSCMSLHS